jgi:hypothetical protein
VATQGGARECEFESGVVAMQVGSCTDGDVLIAVHDESDPQCAGAVQEYQYLSESCQAFCSLATSPEPARGTKDYFGMT